MKTFLTITVIATFIGLAIVANQKPETPDRGITPVQSTDNARQYTSTPNMTLHGYDCTVDCSGHEAGYAWAEEHGISDEDDCSGNSESFIEGCKAYVQENGDDGQDSDENSDDQ